MQQVIILSLKKYLEWTAYVIVPFVLAVLSSVVVERELYTFYGTLAEIGLIFILLLKPISQISGWISLRQLVGLRRPMGVTVFWLALFHGAMLIYERNLLWSDMMGLDNYLFYGVVALLGMIILGITSNNFSLRTLKKNWKRVQYLAYPVLFLTLLHSAMAEGEMIKFYVVSTLFVALKVWAHQKTRKR